MAATLLAIYNALDFFDAGDDIIQVGARSGAGQEAVGDERADGRPQAGRATLLNLFFCGCRLSSKC